MSTPTATSTGVRSAMLPREVARELVGDAPRARAALQRPHERLLARRGDGGFIDTEEAQPLRDDRQVLVLAERIEAQPQAEALGQRDLFLHHLAGMHLAILGV